MILLKNANFIADLTEGGLTRGDILIKAGKITKVATEINPLKEVEVIDVQGKYLLPGFIDLHLHLNLSGGDTLYDNFYDDYYMCIQAYKFAVDTLKAGFTTIRDVGSNNAMINGLRDYINTGNLIGPSIISSGKIITPTEAGNNYFTKMYVEADGCDEVYKAVRGELQKGADFIKVMASGAIMNPGGNPGSPIYSDDELHAMVEAARIKGSYVAAHAHSAEAILQCFKTKVRTVEHASLIDDEGINLALKSKETFLVPTITAFASTVEDSAEGASFINEKVEKFTADFKESIKKAYDAGVKLGFATDQGVEGTFHGENADEFIYRKEIFGMDNLDILKQATIYSAQIARIEDQVGQLKAGLEADIVILDKNPLEDIRACKDNICGVIKKGSKVIDTFDK